MLPWAQGNYTVTVSETSDRYICLGYIPSELQGFLYLDAVKRPEFVWESGTKCNREAVDG